MGNPNDIQVLMQQMKPLPRAFSEIKKELDPSASYVVAEKPCARVRPAEYTELAELAVDFGNLVKSRELIFDSSIRKLILILKLTPNFKVRHFRKVISTNVLQNMKVYLYRNC